VSIIAPNNDPFETEAFAMSEIKANPELDLALGHR